MTNISSKKLLVGLTGGICCGKSTISKTFIKNNIPVLDADQVARNVVIPGSVGLEKIISVFGRDYLQENGTLNRSKLGDLVFVNKQALSYLNEIMSPLILLEATNQLNELLINNNIVIYDAPLLLEMGNKNECYPILTAYCTEEQQIERLMERGTGHGPLTRQQAMDRIAAQMPTSEKARLADRVIYTFGTIEQSILQTEHCIDWLRRIAK